MDSTRQRIEVDQNYDAFQRMLGTLLPTHRNRYALMRDREVVDIFDSSAAADSAGMAAYSDAVFSIQEITDEPIDLGFFSHVAH